MSKPDLPDSWEYRENEHPRTLGEIPEFQFFLDETQWYIERDFLNEISSYPVSQHTLRLIIWVLSTTCIFLIKNLAEDEGVRRDKELEWLTNLINVLTKYAVDVHVWDSATTVWGTTQRVTVTLETQNNS